MCQDNHENSLLLVHFHTIVLVLSLIIILGTQVVLGKGGWAMAYADTFEFLGATVSDLTSFPSRCYGFDTCTKVLVRNRIRGDYQ